MASKTDAYLRYLISDGKLSSADVFVFSDRKHSEAIDYARRIDIEAIVYPSYEFKSLEVNRKAYDFELGKLVFSKKPDLVVLAGWMHILSQNFLDWLPSKSVINVHAALLPKNPEDKYILLPDNTTSRVFRGLGAVKQALRARVTFTGATVHWVTCEVDKGEVILQKTIAIEKFENEKTLARKMFPIECELLGAATNSILTQKGFKV